MHTYMHTYIHTYIQTYIHTYLHTYIHTYIHKGCVHCICTCYYVLVVCIHISRVLDAISLPPSPHTNRAGISVSPPLDTLPPAITPSPLWIPPCASLHLSNYRDSSLPLPSVQPKSNFRPPLILNFPQPPGGHPYPLGTPQTLLGAMM